MTKTVNQESKSALHELEEKMRQKGHLLEDATKKRDIGKKRYSQVTHDYYKAKRDYRQALKEYLNAKLRIESWGLKSA